MIAKVSEPHPAVIQYRIQPARNNRLRAVHIFPALERELSFERLNISLIVARLGAIFLNLHVHHQLKLASLRVRQISQNCVISVSPDNPSARLQFRMIAHPSAESSLGALPMPAILTSVLNIELSCHDESLFIAAA